MKETVSLVDAAASASTSAPTSTSTTSASAVNHPIPLSIQLVPQNNVEGVTGFFPFNDLDDIASIQNRGLFQRLPITPAINGNLHISLFPAGCRIQANNGGQVETDCHRACQDPATIFGSLETFYNCAALSAVVYWTSSVNVFYVPEEAERNASLLMAGVPLADFDAKPTLSCFVSCAEAACENDNLRMPCSHSVMTLTPKSEPLVVLEAMSSFCPQLPVDINPDIFGPGVLISYVLQVCFASLLFVFVKIFVIWVHHVQQSKTKTKQGPVSRMNLPRRLTWHDSSALSRTSIALATTLVEFQEAQCWFVFAIQIASILTVVVSSQGGTFWAEIIVNASVAFHVSQNGILSMFLIQICLHSEGIRNWHTFVGFFAEYLLAIVATSQTIYFQDAFELFRKQKQLRACGGNPSPRSYCSSMRVVDGFHLSFFPRPYVYKIVFLVLDTVTILILLADQLSWTLRTNRRTKNLRVCGHPVGHGPVGRYKPMWDWFKKWLWRLLELAYFVINILYMISLVKVFNHNSFDASKWSYGQIIAMTVWGPVIVKLFDLVISGPPKNGSTLTSGPPRLRIDNVINQRLGKNPQDDAYSTRPKCTGPSQSTEP
ncbi:hypothetical protein L249_0052 [Ophiocordyceps polyrhachis-furcata BCC 54312]|uniref:Uncharacterized protein n=1 Tax=Ophiocordyceps polyrhachis-furcata BCC 54312 TaxID=1330021 RepID=A0A367LFB4_9HYPO|nr:hypothetical protein L249_0052 [Ophiocordyceps polyrhachis-furcata BCC 54312]